MSKSPLKIGGLLAGANEPNFEYFRYMQKNQSQLKRFKRQIKILKNFEKSVDKYLPL
jgi:hypothetical protein